MSQTVILRGDSQRMLAKALIDKAPVDAVVTVKEATRTLEQNSMMWSILSTLARAKPDGRILPAHKWKSLAMDAAGKKPDWERSLDGDSMVCVGYKSSRLTKAEMSDVIEAIFSYGAAYGVKFD